MIVSKVSQGLTVRLMLTSVRVIRVVSPGNVLMGSTILVVAAKSE